MDDAPTVARDAGITGTTSGLAPRLGRRFEALVVVDGRTDAGLDDRVTGLLSELLDAGSSVAVVSATAAVPDALGGSRPVHPALLVVDRRAVEVVHVGPSGTSRTLVGAVPDPAVLSLAADTTCRLLEASGVPAVGAPSDDGHATVVDVVPDEQHPRPAQVRLGPAGLAELASAAARQAGLVAPRIRVEGGRIELALADERDAVRVALDRLRAEGVSADDVAVLLGTGVSADIAAELVLDPPAPTVVLAAEPGELVAELAAQLARRTARELPDAEPAPGWGLVDEGTEPERERVRAAMFSVSDGRVGVSGATTVSDGGEPPAALVAGVYDEEGPPTHLLPAPAPGRVEFGVGPLLAVRRVLDLRHGIVHETATTSSGTVDTVRFVAATRDATFVRRSRGPAAACVPSVLEVPDGATVVDEERSANGDEAVVRVAASSGGVATAARADVLDDGAGSACDLVAAYEGDPDAVPASAGVRRRVREAHDVGFDRLLAEHRAAWARRWEDADIVVEGDERLQTALRFAGFHLLSSVAGGGEAAVGARGLSGTGYRGHVFWDADTFVLPCLAATRPEAARAMLEYRIRRLPAAFARATAVGRRGAWFPWESARTGDDVTPASARDRTGRLVPIRTGLLEQHIVADVAWAATQYVEWTGDEAFEQGPHRRLLAATARFWASRARVESDGRAHIWGVVGPDEYHEPVDDNAFTNVMARWNLRRAAAGVPCDDPAGLEGDPVVTAAERDEWLRLADALVDGFDADTGVYEQFAGFASLEPLIIEDVAPRRPIVADLLLGADRVRRSQVLKQADVLMLHHLVPDEVEPDTLDENLRYYEPRTAHGSSLSPAIHAGLFARARDFDRALWALDIASRIDLDDLTETTSGGLHLATMGGLWQAMVFGFGGLRPAHGRLRVDPRLPPRWSALEVRVRFRGHRVVVRKERRSLLVRADGASPVEIDGTVHMVGPDGVRFERRGRTWHPSGGGS